MKRSGRRMQNVSFRSVDEFLEYLPDKELKIVKELRSIVRECLPLVTETLSYNVPYYKMRKNICFIWPASVVWGHKNSYEGVRFGFTYGSSLRDEINYLEKGNRKQVYWKDFTNGDQIDKELLMAYIFEAALVDEQFHKSDNRANKYGIR